MSRFEYKVLEIRVNRRRGPKVVEDLGVRVDELGADGWELDKCVPIQTSAWLPLSGSCTESVSLSGRGESEASDG